MYERVHGAQLKRLIRCIEGRYARNVKVGADTSGASKVDSGDSQS